VRKPVAKSHAFQFFLRHRHGIGNAPELQRHGDIFQGGHGWNEVEGLEDDANGIAAESSKGILILALEQCTCDFKDTGGCSFKSGNQHQQRGFARS
jgi:hypothetical protein